MTSNSEGINEAQRGDSTERLNRRHVLRMAGGGAVGLSALSGCTDSGVFGKSSPSPTVSPVPITIPSPTPTPTAIPTVDPEATYLYEALEGTWCGRNEPPGWLRLEISGASVKPGEGLGHIRLSASKDGALACAGRLSALRSHPPNYFAIVNITTGHCRSGQLRFKLRPEDGELDYYHKPEDEERFKWVAILDRNNCAASTPEKCPPFCATTGTTSENG